MKEKLLKKGQEIEDIIYRFLPAEEGYQKTIFEAMNYSVRAGGKRLRPVLMYETYKMFNGTSKAIEPFMAAIEMIHTYSLVHDDLPSMDNDLLRRGKPTTHAVYGEGMAVLAGDALLNYAFETAIKAFSISLNDTELIVKSLEILSSKAGIYGMIGGQVVDVESEKSGEITKDKIDFIYALKTGALIEASMMIGATLAGASAEDIEAIESVADKIGLAFQIQDDILDIIGNEEELGKPIGSDVKNEKATFVTYAGIDNASSEVKRLTEEAISELNELSHKNEFLCELLNYLVYRNN